MMNLGTSLFFIFNFQLIYGWNDSYEKSDDQHVLTVFLPLLGIAILACAGGCCYMEKKRKERLKRGGTVDTDDESDAESVISTSTVRSRPFLLPSTTTGRISRTGSRPGSMRSYRSNYDQTEKPPSYLYEKDSQGGLHMTAHEPDEISFYGGSVRSSVRDTMERGGFDNQALQRSSSMIDVRGGRRGMQDPARGRPQIRRSQSVIGFNEDPRGGYNSAAEQPSPTPSNWSVRTAPQVDYRRAPSSTSGHGGGGGRPPQFSTNQLKRSMSQPDLRGGHGGATMTYPQGILKRTASTSGLDGDAARYYLGKTNNSSDSGVKDLYYQQELGTRGYDRYEEYSDKMNHHRGDPYMAAQRRPASMVGYGTYSNAGYGGYEDTNQLYGGYSTRPPRQMQQQQQQPRAHHQHQLPRRQPQQQQQQHPANYGTMPPHYQPHYSMSEYGNYEAYNYRRRPEVAGGRASYNTKPSNSRMHDPYSYRGY